MDTLFYIGQKVIAITDAPQNNEFKKGDEFTILDIIQTSCRCKNIIVRVEVSRDYTVFNKNTTCSNCKQNILYSEYTYFNQTRFAPLQDISNMSYEDAITYVEPIKQLM